MPHAMVDIEKSSQRCADAYDRLGDLAAELDAAITTVKDEHMRAIRYAIEGLNKRTQELREMITEAPELFADPKTQVFHGVKVGYQKGKGKIVIDDPDRTVELIRKIFPDRTDELIATIAAPRKTAIDSLAAGDLKKIGCRIDGDGEQVVLRHVASDNEKLIRALLKAKPEEE
jgi:monomeric isocitrate dehydrogenase